MSYREFNEYVKWLDKYGMHPDCGRWYNYGAYYVEWDNDYDLL